MLPLFCLHVRRHLSPLVDGAAPGEVAVSPAVWAALGGLATGRPIGGGGGDGGDASPSVGMVIEGLRGEEGAAVGGVEGREEAEDEGGQPPPSPVAAATAAALPATRAFLPLVVCEHADAGHQRWLAENRHVTTLFIKLPTPSEASFDLAQSLMLCIQAAEQRWHGMVRQLITDDKVRGLV